MLRSHHDLRYDRNHTYRLVHISPLDVIHDFVVVSAFDSFYRNALYVPVVCFYLGCSLAGTSKYAGYIAFLGNQYNITTRLQYIKDHRPDSMYVYGN